MSILRKNILFNLIGQAIVIPLSFISFKYIYSGLGDDALGIIYFSLMLSAIFSSALDMGLSKTTVREIAAHHLEEPEYIKRLIQTFSSFYWLAYISVITLFVYFLSEIVNSWINLTTMGSELAYNVLLILGITSLLAIPKMLLASVCIGLQRMDINNSIEVAFAVLQQIGIIVLLIKDNDLIVIAYWMAAINIIKVLIYMVFISRLLSIKVMFPLFSMEVVNRVKKYTSKMMFLSLLLVIHKQLDKVLLSKLLPIGVMGIYSFAYSSVSKTSLVTAAVAQAVFPSFSQLKKQGRQKDLEDRFFMLQDLLVFITLPMFVFVFFLAEPVFEYLLDAKKAEMLLIPTLLLSLSFYLNAALRIISTYVSAIGKPEYIIRSNVIALAIVTPVTIIMIVKMGVVGAALSWVIYYIVGALSIVPIFYKKELNKPANMWFKSVINVLVLSSLIYFPSWILANMYFPGYVMPLLIAYLVSSIIYGIVVLNIVGSGLRNIILSYVPSAKFMLFTKI
jgi:O-antigen/teichoic acid export membrane protein